MASLAFLLIFQMLLSLAESGCPDGFGYWYQYGKQISTYRFRPSCYKFVRTDFSWNQARKHCRQLEGDLVTIETAGENNHLKHIIRRHHELLKPELTDYRYYGYWTGGNDQLREGDWRWADTNTKISFSDWNPGEPSNSDRPHRNENCLQLFRVWDWKWNDLYCGDETQGSICEISGNF